MMAEMKSIKGKLNSAIAKDMKKLLSRAAADGANKENIRDGSCPKLYQDMISNLASDNDYDKSTCLILDYSLEAGTLGKHLVNDGFSTIVKLDTSKKNLEQAAETASYTVLQKVEEDVSISDEHLGMYDFVAAPISKNNTGLDKALLEKLLPCLKVGGHIVFSATDGGTSEADEKVLQYFSE